MVVNVVEVDATKGVVVTDDVVAGDSVAACVVEGAGVNTGAAVVEMEGLFQPR